MVNSAWNRVFGLFCLLCGLPVTGRSPAMATNLCAGCVAELPHLGEHCPQCGLPMPVAQLCGQCLRDPPPYRCCIAPLLYRAPVSQLVARFKYGGHFPSGSLLCDQLLWRLQREPPPPVDLLAPVPLHWQRRWTRGFNQAEIIGDTLSRALRLPFVVDLLRRTRATPPQQSLSAAERRRNLRGVFALTTVPLAGNHAAGAPAAGAPLGKPATSNVAGKNIALIDDVVTTGATATEIAQLLIAAGARSVQVWCLARTP